MTIYYWLSYRCTFVCFDWTGFTLYHCNILFIMFKSHFNTCVYLNISPMIDVQQLFIHAHCLFASITSKSSWLIEFNCSVYMTTKCYAHLCVTSFKSYLIFWQARTAFIYMVVCCLHVLLPLSSLIFLVLKSRLNIYIFQVLIKRPWGHEALCHPACIYQAEKLPILVARTGCLCWMC